MPISDEDKLELSSLINTIFTAREQSAMKKAEVAAAAREEAFLAKINESIAGSLQPTSEGDDKPKGPFAARVAELEKQVKAEREGRKAEARNSRMTAATAEMGQALTAKIGSADKARIIIAGLQHTGALRFNESGVPTFVVRRQRYEGGAVEDQPHDNLLEGLEDWYATAEARAFLPAVPPGEKKPAPTQAQLSRSRQGEQINPGVRIQGNPNHQPEPSEDELLSRSAERLGMSSADLFASINA